MAYVVVVFAIINSLALLGAGYLFWYMAAALEATIQSAIQEEVRKQDDRIEKRLARAERPAEDIPETTRDGAMRVGQPYRR